MNLFIPFESITGILFYAFSFILIASSLGSVTAKRSVHAVLFLVLAFFSAAWIFLTRGAEFIAMMLIIIYVGAIAVLFLFVVMMLEEPNAEVKKFKRGWFNMLFSFGIGFLLFLELFVIIMTTRIGIFSVTEAPAFNIKDVGRVLYTEYFFEFQTVGLLFFTAMVGAIVLTMFPSALSVKTKRQNFFKQVSRGTESVVLANPESGKGVKTD